MSCVETSDRTQCYFPSLFISSSASSCLAPPFRVRLPWSLLVSITNFTTGEEASLSQVATSKLARNCKVTYKRPKLPLPLLLLPLLGLHHTLPSAPDCPQTPMYKCIHLCVWCPNVKMAVFPDPAFRSANVPGVFISLHLPAQGSNPERM